MDLFLKNMQLFTSQDVYWQIIVFLSAVWTLILVAPIYFRGPIVLHVM